MHHPTLCAVAVALLSVLPGAQANLYKKSSPVLQVGTKDYGRLIAGSNHTSIVEFYAPWCGHCQSMKPIYEKAAKNLEGLAKVAAVNCDDDANKQLCSSMGVKGYPTIKIIRPPAVRRKGGGGKSSVEDYNGPRTAAGIVDAVVAQINNHVKKVTDKDLDDFLSDASESPKAILFTEKGTTTALIKSIAIDFLDVISFAQVRNKETAAVEKFGIEKFPTLVLLPGGGKDAVHYDGELKKPAIVEFLSQAGEPNPDPAPVAAKPNKKSSAPKAETTTSEDAPEPSTSPETQEAPVILNTPPPIPAINTAEKLAKECLAEKSPTCLLAVVQATPNEDAKQALDSLSSLAFKYAQGQHHLFPMYEVTREGNEAVDSLYKSLELSGEVELIAVNARRGWWRRYEGSDFDTESVAAWVDAIRMGEGGKKELPEGIVGVSFAEAEAGEESESQAATEEEPAKETVKHEEL